MTKMTPTSSNFNMNKALKTNLIHFRRMPTSDLTKKHLIHWRTPNVIQWSLRDKRWLVPLKMKRDKELKLLIGLLQLARVEVVIAHAVPSSEQSKNVLTNKLIR